MRLLRQFFFSTVLILASTTAARAGVACGGDVGRGTIFSGISRVDFYDSENFNVLHTEGGKSSPTYSQTDFKNLLRDIIKENFSKCFDVNAKDAIGFSNRADVSIVGDEHTLVIFLRKAQLFSDGSERVGITPEKFPSLGRFPYILTVDFYRHGASPDVQADVLGQWSSSLSVPDVADKGLLKTYISDFLRNAIRPRLTVDGEDNISKRK